MKVAESFSTLKSLASVQDRISSIQVLLESLFHRRRGDGLFSQNSLSLYLRVDSFSTGAYMKQMMTKELRLTLDQFGSIHDYLDLPGWKGIEFLMSMSMCRCLLILDVAWESFAERRNFCRTIRVTILHGWNFGYHVSLHSCVVMSSHLLLYSIRSMIPQRRVGSDDLRSIIKITKKKCV